MINIHAYCMEIRDAFLALEKERDDAIAAKEKAGRMVAFDSEIIGMLEAARDELITERDAEKARTDKAEAHARLVGDAYLELSNRASLVNPGVEAARAWRNGGVKETVRLKEALRALDASLAVKSKRCWCDQDSDGSVPQHDPTCHVATRAAMAKAIRWAVREHSDLNEGDILELADKVERGEVTPK